MITAVDTSVLLDVMKPDLGHGPASRDALARCLSEGSLTACEVVWAEVAARFSSVPGAIDAMRHLGVAFAPADSDTATVAGMAWGAYRRAGGTRERLIPDFLVGAHAMLHADRLLTRDKGFYRTYFKDLEVLQP